MKFRPCIDIHNGKVKQVVGSTIRDEGDTAKENFVSEKDASDYSRLYQSHQLNGGHIILLNGKDSEYYEVTKAQAMGALKAYPGGMQIGGGICAENAMEFLDAGASHVIVTSYVFSNGMLNMEHLKKICQTVGKNRLVLDRSCRKKDGQYYIVTDRWQNFTEEVVNEATLEQLGAYCDEFLIHAVDVEGKNNGVETELVELLGKWEKNKITYAGGIRGLEDIELLKNASGGKLDYTIGSALSIFGGKLDFDKIVEINRN